MEDMKYEKRCFDLYLWQNDGDHFTCMLYTLIHKSDLENRGRLRRAFPVEVAVWEEWMASESPDVFYDKHNIVFEEGQTGRWRKQKCNTGTS